MRSSQAQRVCFILLLCVRRLWLVEGFSCQASPASWRRSQHPSLLPHWRFPTLSTIPAASEAQYDPSKSKLHVSTAPTSSEYSDNAAASNTSRKSIVDVGRTLDPNFVSPSAESGNAAVNSSNPNSASLPFPLVLWKFSRPHTLIGSAIAIPALHLLAAPTWSAVWTVATLQSITYAMLPSLLMNIYITGLNQITDVDIDKINKPYLVLPAGIMSRKSAIATVVVCLVASLALGQVPGSPLSTPGLAVALWGSAILGTLYSLPPFRLKRFPLLAAFCIVAVRGTIINASFFAHATAAAFGGGKAAGGVLNALRTDPRCWLSSLFYCVFGVVIALMKDVPDVSGDQHSNVRTFSVRLGQEQVFHLSRRLLTGLFWVFGAGLARSAVMAPTLSLQVGRSVVAVAALLAGNSVRRQSRTVNPTNSQQVYQYYMHLWKLFYASYLALPFAR